MGKNTITKWSETVVLLLVLSAAVLTPYLAFNFMDLELFSVSKTLWSSINPWLYPPYVYLLINFIIFFIFASSFIHSNTTLFNPANDHNQSYTNSFIESSLASEDPPVGSLFEDETKFHTPEDSFKDVNDDLQFNKVPNDVVPESLVDKRELRKSKTFHEGGSRPVSRRERYVRILSQDELDRRVEAFIYRFKKENKVEFR
ncbi:hypothetical protein HanIR_Chr01g0012691 [Helianthus annuus]|nr:hypothetical protein HanIR_Chr01g0012691 [Helianthus annuus]